MNTLTLVSLTILAVFVVAYLVIDRQGTKDNEPPKS